MKNTILNPNRYTNQEGVYIGVAYDTAWTARVTDQRGKPVFPECVQWLLKNQKSDGSWGSQVQNYHDRIISTLSALIALKELDKNQYSPCIHRGETYIWETLKNIPLDSSRLIGSELLIPTLMEQAESVGLNLPYHLKIYTRAYKAKLEKIDESLWYSPFTTLSFSLEFLGNHVDTERLPDAQLPNGSVTNSPAATAFFLQHTKDARAFMYLKKVLSLTGDGSVMTIYPTEVFEYSWTMYNLILAGLYFNRYTEICTFLHNNIGNSGIGWSTESMIPDADDTAIVLKTLYNMQCPVDFRVFEAYDAGDYYLTFQFELDPSVSTNIHILDCARNSPEFPDRDEVIERLLHFLRRTMHAGFWLDKWHASPYYPTSHAVFALCDFDLSLAEKAISWILETQHEHGLWGVNSGTLEETMYAVQALMYYHIHVEPIDLESVHRALSAVTYITGDHTELWVGKVLYTSVPVVYSSVFSAQYMVRMGNLLIAPYVWV